MLLGVENLSNDAAHRLRQKHRVVIISHDVFAVNGIRELECHWVKKTS